MKKKIHPDVFLGLQKLGYSNRQIGELVGVSEATVRRGLATVIDPSPRRQFLITVEEV